MRFLIAQRNFLLCYFSIVPRERLHGRLSYLCRSLSLPDQKSVGHLDNRWNVCLSLDFVHFGSDIWRDNPSQFGILAKDRPALCTQVREMFCCRCRHWSGQMRSLSCWTGRSPKWSRPTSRCLCPMPFWSGRRAGNKQSPDDGTLRTKLFHVKQWY